MFKGAGEVIVVNEPLIGPHRSEKLFEMCLECLAARYGPAMNVTDSGPLEQAIETLALALADPESLDAVDRVWAAGGCHLTVGLLGLSEILLGLLAASGEQSREQWLQVIALQVADVNAPASAEMPRSAAATGGPAASL